MRRGRTERGASRQLGRLGVALLLAAGSAHCAGASSPGAVDTAEPQSRPVEEDATGGGEGQDASGSDASATVPGAPEDDSGDASPPPGSDGGGDDADDGGDAAACAPTTGGMRGLTMQTATVGGVARTYLMYLPAAIDPSTPAPLVMVFHGSTMDGQQMHDITQYADLADQEGFAVVFPDGEGAPIYLAPWNVENPGQTVCGAGQLISASGDDFGFVDAMESAVASYQCLDSRHVFVTGFSMGGYFSHHVGCYRDDVRAVAPHSGGTLASLSDCTTGHKPIIIFHGTADGTIAPGCDDPNSPAQAGFPPSATLWAQKNGCAATYTTAPEVGDGGGSGQCYLFDGCPADGQVELCTFTGMGHCWAGGSTSGQGALSACPQYPSATALEWAFFKQYAW